MIRRNAARKRHEGARALCLAALVVAIVLSACTGENESVVVLGSLDDIEMGSVRTFQDVGGDSGRWEELPRGAIETEPIPVDLHVVRYRERMPGQEGESDVLGVFLGRDPHSGCPVTWEADREFDGRPGWFVAGCTGSIFDRDGVRVFGPSPRDLDRFSPLVDEHGELSVDLDALLIGADRTQADPGGTPTPTNPPMATVPAPPHASPTPLDLPFTVWLVDADTTAVTTLAEEDTHSPSARFADSGASVLVSELLPGGLLTFVEFDLTGRRVGPGPEPECREIDGAVLIDGRTYHDVPCGLIAPEGRSMLYGMSNANVTHPLLGSDMWLLDLDTDQRVLVQEGLVPCGGCDGIYGPSWSPDGRYVVYAETGGDGRVFLTNVSTGATRVLTHGNGIHARPDWSPRGDALLFQEDGEAFVLDLATDVRRSLPVPWPARWDPTGTYVYSPAWLGEDSPRSTTIVHAPSGDWVDTLSGQPPWTSLWIETTPMTALEGGGYTAALEGGEDCDGVAVHSTLRADVLCVEDATGAVVSPDGRQVAVPVATERRLGPYTVPHHSGATLARFEVLLVDVASGDRRVLGTGDAWGYDDAFHDNRAPQPPLITWNRSGTHVLVQWPLRYGL